MRIEMVNNYIRFDDGLSLPFYLYKKLISQCSETNYNKYIHLLINSYNINIHSFVKPKLLMLMMSLFNVNIELYSNPLINVVQYCSNNDVDKYFGGVAPLESYRPTDSTSMIFIDPRPSLVHLENISTTKNDKLINDKLQKSISLIKNNIDLSLSLIIISYYKLELPSEFICTLFELNFSDKLYIHFIQTQKGYIQYKPTISKIQLIKSFISSKSQYYKKYKKNIEYYILGSKKYLL